MYLVDVTVAGRMFQEQPDNLRTLLQRFRAANLKLIPVKFRLFLGKMRSLGHIVSPEGETKYPEKLEAVQRWTPPRDKHELRSFLGLCTDCRSFIGKLLTSPSR
jgi:hypothetical protein